MKNIKPLDIFIVNELQAVSINQGKKDIEQNNYILNEDLHNEVMKSIITNKEFLS